MSARKVVSKAEMVALKQYANTLYPDIELQENFHDEPTETADGQKTSDKHKGSWTALLTIRFAAFLGILINLAAIAINKSDIVIVAGIIAILVSATVFFLQGRIENIDCKFQTNGNRSIITDIDRLVLS